VARVYPETPLQADRLAAVAQAEALLSSSPRWKAGLSSTASFLWSVHSLLIGNPPAVLTPH
jgi:hypothetical protein